MSNCDFYAIREDLVPLLNIIYEETDCRVFESYSEYSKELREFNSTDEILKAFDVGQCKTKAVSILLQLYSPSAKGKFIIEKINLDPKKCQGHTLRYNAGGWGLIQLYLGGIFEIEKKVIHSHLGHNSEARAKKWASTNPDYGKPEEWDWKALNSTSRKIANYINKRLSTEKVNGRSILTNAVSLLQEGYKIV